MEKNQSRMTKIVFVGATRNFFKVGHTTIKTIQRDHPDVALRLALPDISEAANVVQGTNVELMQWNPSDSNSLRKVFQGCTASLLVPPVNNRVAVAKQFI